MDLVNNTEQKRIIYFDYLRIFATLAVIGIHCLGEFWYTTDEATLQWNILNAGDSLLRWSVPVFIMISGALFLGRERIIRKLFAGNILRIVTAFLFWSTVYVIADIDRYGYSFKEAVKQIIEGHYHLWFLNVIVGLYLAVPIFHKIVESKKITRYFLAVALVFGCILPQAISLLYLFSDGLAEALDKALNTADIGVVTGFSFYFVCGYCLHRAEISPGWRRIIYIIGVCGGLFTVAGTAGVSLWRGAPNEIFYEYTGINVICVSMAVFVFGKYHFTGENVSAKREALVRRLSKYSFGAYLSHVLVLDATRRVSSLYAPELPQLAVICLMYVCGVILSFAISAILNRIPVINKYLA